MRCSVARVVCAEVWVRLCGDCPVHVVECCSSLKFTAVLICSMVALAPSQVRAVTVVLESLSLAVVHVPLSEL